MIHAHRQPRVRYGALAALALLAVMAAFLYNANTSRALTTPSVATVDISADTAANATTPAFTTLANIIVTLDTNLDGDGGASVSINAPLGWQFGATPLPVFSSAGCTFAEANVFSGQVVALVSTGSICLAGAQITVSGVQVRPVSGSTTTPGNVTAQTSAEGPIDVVTLTMVPGAITSFAIDNASGGALMDEFEDTNFSILISARDQFNSTVTGFTGNVDLSALDAESTVVTFTGDGSVGPFVAGEFTAVVRFSAPVSDIHFDVVGASVGAISSSFSILATPLEVSATALTATPATSYHGEAVALTATVTHALSTPPTGDVQFLAGTDVIATATLVDGVASANYAGLDVGVHSLTARYLASLETAASTSSPVSHEVIRASSTTSLNAPATAQFGAAVQLVASVSTVGPATAVPAGTVEFYDGTTLLGSATIVDSVATLDLPGLTVGSHSLTAEYMGSVSIDPSTSSAVSHVVSPGQTTTTITGPSIVPPDVTFTLSATVAPVAPATAAPQGTVIFFDGAVVLGTVALVDGAAQLDLALDTPGVHLIRAEYSGDASYVGSTSTHHTLFVDPFATLITLIISNNGGVVTFTGTVLPSEATGSVVFMEDDGTVLGIAALSGGVATFTATLSAQAYSVTAVYGGDANFSGSTSGRQTVVVWGIIPNPPGSPTVSDEPAAPVAPTTAPTATIPSTNPPASPTPAPPTSETPATAPSATLTADSAPGATTLQTGLMVGFNIGDRVVINPGGANEEFAIISGLDPLTFTTALLNAHLAGEQIVRVGRTAEPIAPASTPLPPSTGTGLVSDTNSFALLLGLAGLAALALASGATTLTLRKRS